VTATKQIRAQLPVATKRDGCAHPEGAILRHDPASLSRAAVDGASRGSVDYAAARRWNEVWYNEWREVRHR